MHHYRRSQGGGARGPELPPIEMSPMIKGDKNALFFQFQFLFATLHTTVIHNNIGDQGGRAPSIQIL